MSCMTRVYVPLWLVFWSSCVTWAYVLLWWASLFGQVAWLGLVFRRGGPPSWVELRDSSLCFIVVDLFLLLSCVTQACVLPWRPPLFGQVAWLGLMLRCGRPSSLDELCGLGLCSVVADLLLLLSCMTQAYAPPWWASFFGRVTWLGLALRCGGLSSLDTKTHFQIYSGYEIIYKPTIWSMYYISHIYTTFV